MQKNKLYWKISATLLGLLVVLGITYVLISGYIARQYFEEVNQKLYGNIATYMSNEVHPFVEGEVDTLAMQDIMHSMMTVNPSVEVYLLDTVGNIITYVAPYKRVKLESVNLTPVNEFIATEEKPFIKGDNPRFPGEQSVFSAAEIRNENKLQGYFYIVLASEEQSAITSTLFGSYMLKLGANMFFITLFGALAIGLLAIWLLTRSLRSIIFTVKRFKEGDQSARIAEKEKGDLTELADTYNEMADTIVANIDQLKSVEKLRQELIANVSHDLRTPVSIIQGYVETLMMKKDVLPPKDQERYLNIVLSSTEKLSTQINQLFEYSKLESKQIEPQKEAFFLSELVQDSCQKYDIIAKAKNINIRMELPETAQLVFADVQLVETVLQNLMDNALKFTPEGGEIHVALENTENSVQVKVSDTGPGIPENEQSFIFERYRMAKGNEKKANSTGLGLAIVKKILELHNAKIQVQSRVNEGAAFMFKLPVYSN
jgi:signal transduction histidine kinase